MCSLAEGFRPVVLWKEWNVEWYTILSCQVQFCSFMFLFFAKSSTSVFFNTGVRKNIRCDQQDVKNLDLIFSNDLNIPVGFEGVNITV
jgi:hypothetical protein